MERSPVQRSPNVVETYATQFTPAMLDLSCPSPGAASAPSVDLGGSDLEFPVPGGSGELRACIAGLYEHLQPDDILVTNGASEALAALAAGLGGSARRFAVAPEVYPSLTEVARLAGTELAVRSDLDGASALVVTNPTIPDGRRVDVRAVIDRAVAAGVTPIVDEVYRHITLDGDPVAAAADMHPFAVSIGDLSKPLGLGGLRIGWIATRNAEVREAAMRWLRVFTGGPSTLSDAAARVAIDTFEAQVATHSARARRNAFAIYAELRSAGWRFESAELGLTVCAYPPYSVSEAALSRLRDSGFFLFPADSLGRPGGFRIGLLTPSRQLRAALRLLARLASDASDALIVLTRVPRPGVGKSRLAALLGVERTFRVASAFAEDTLRLAASGSGWRQLVAYTPNDAEEEAAALADGIEIVPQAAGDLGVRIASALDVALRDSSRAVLIGSDTPDLPPEVIERAFAALNDADAVIGPAEDGGFYLVGVRATHLDMFTGVEWSTETVFERTESNLRRLGWRVAVLDAWEDVDDLASLVALARRLDAAEAAGRAPATRSAIAEIGEGATT